MLLFRNKKIILRFENFHKNSKRLKYAHWLDNSDRLNIKKIMKIFFLQIYLEETAFISSFQHPNVVLMIWREILVSVLNFEQVNEKKWIKFFKISKFNVSVFANHLSSWTSVFIFVVFADLLFRIKNILLFMNKTYLWCPFYGRF